MTPEGIWRAKIAELKPGDVAMVITTTERDEEGISYDVSVSLRSLATHAFEMGEDMMHVWEHTVTFVEAEKTGGTALAHAAHSQERVATEVWILSRPK